VNATSGELRKIRIYPPLAIARLGKSEVPLEAYHWGANDDRPDGTGKTTILPADTLSVAADGAVSSYRPSRVRFKDEEGFRPVCPFFELHAEWIADGRICSGPVTPELLARFGLDVPRVRWVVEVANLKPYFMTRDRGTRIEARIVLSGDDVEARTLEGVGPADVTEPLVPRGRHIPLGTVRLTRPTTRFPELRLRFTPAKGHFYGPVDLLGHWSIQFPEENLFLDPRSAWCGWRPGADDPRGAPGDQYAHADDDDRSYGLVDDVCDGVITCTLDGTPLAPAYARITVGPPDYAPDRRHVISLADGLKDRVGRAEVFDRGYVENMDLTGREVRDLMERVLETLELINLDVFNDRIKTQLNPFIASRQGMATTARQYAPFSPLPPLPHDPLLEVLEDFLRKRPDLIDTLVRPPRGDSPLFDKRMPAIMRGASGEPLHLTRRQYDVLVLWAKRLHELAQERP
jgi:hypothetical protein